VCATIDLASKDAPAMGHGNAGKAQSGRTFMSGLLAQSGTHIWHEGIKQTVSGLTPGLHYEITLHQAVVKQDNKSSFHCFDQTGAWTIYVDGELLTVTESSKSELGVENVKLDWDERTVEFIATASHHTFSFLPHDDDGEIESEKLNEGVRMGLDNVSIHPVEEIEPALLVEEVQELIDPDSRISIEPENMELLVYPNPTSEYARLKVDQEFSAVVIQLYDMQGKLLFVNEFQRGDDMQFKLDGERGTYLLRVKVDEHEWETIRVQKAH
jgi:hypothetical protein